MTALPQFINTKIGVVWGVLVVATIISWQVGTHGNDPEFAASVVLVIAFAKIWLVGSYFMEIKDAPDVLRRGFDGYVVAVCAALIGMYLVL